MSQVIVVGGGLAGLAAAHSALDRGARVTLIDKNPFLGGNSTKATSGINAAVTNHQIRQKIPDSVDIFLADTAASGKQGEATGQQKVLVYDSAPAVDWLERSFGLNLSIISRLGGHSQPRTHRGPEKFPGMTITYALMEKFEEIATATPARAQLLTKCRATKLITDASGAVTGVEYTKADGSVGTEHGVVVISTGGFGADFSENSLLAKYRPDLLPLPTTNGDHTTGDGIKLSEAVGAGLVDMKQVQVHPTGLVHPDEPNSKIKFLAAEALRGVGGILLDKNGKRFVDELQTRDYVTGVMQKHNQGPYRLVLNGAAGKEIEWHCQHYCGRGLMKKIIGVENLAKEIGVPAERVKQTFDEYNAASKGGDKYGKKYFNNLPWKADDTFWVSWVVPVLHYCMGGVAITPNAEVTKEDRKTVIPGLFAAGEVTGGVHGNNRLGGSSLADCVVYGRVAGASAAKFLLSHLIQNGGSASGANAGVNVNVTNGKVTIEIKTGGASTGASTPAAPASSSSSSAAPAATPAPAAPAKKKEYTLEEVAKHNTEKDCWVVVNGEVLDCTGFLKNHPGGAKAILLYAGKDASHEFNMLHKADVVAKYAPETIIGTLKGATKSKL